LQGDNQKIYSNIIDNIKKYRKIQGLTQQGLAMRANMSKGYLSQIESKNYNKFCSIEMLINISNALNVPLYKLFLFDEEK
jgi:DNA-binding helix-turn-helix protein